MIHSITIIIINIILLSLIITAFTEEIPLDNDRKACRTEEITFVPNNKDFYDEPVKLTFDSAISLNHVLVTQMVEEECGFRDKIFHDSHKRGKRSLSSDVPFSLNDYFLEFYRKSEKTLKPELLKGIRNVFEHLKHLKTPMGQVKSSGMDKFFYQMWKDLEAVRAQYNDEHFDLMLEQTFRTSLQLLIQNEEISDILLYHPIIRDTIKRRIPITNGELLSRVQVSKRKTIEKCDDIGTISHNTYHYYELPTATFRKNGHVYKVDIEGCFLDSFIFCPFETIRPTDCSKENVKNCHLKAEINSVSVIRELHNGFAVYGDFSQILIKNGDHHSRMYIAPYSLYHIVPQSEETISIDEYDLRQKTNSRISVINQM
uniref:Secreted protein n=1 Tax=Caenorhabditis tropicalis TaxID=1561998 RepID=A0A1I7U872_9PELO